MRALNRKLLRDLAAMKGQGVAIAAVVAAGVTIFVMSMITLRSLTIARADYYASHRFADLFVSLKRAPLDLARRASEIQGVAAVEPRIMSFMTLDMPGLAEPATGQVLSIPGQARRGLNQLFVSSGRWPLPHSPREVLVSDGFAASHQLQLGDTLAATLHGRRQTLQVVGVAMSPEFLVQVAPGSLFPDDHRFGVFWMARKPLAAAADLEGAFNHLSLQLVRNANESEVIRRLDRLLEPHGGAGAYGRDLHYSAHFIDDEITGLRTMAVFSPLIFLSVAGFLLHISLRRILSLQHEQIATLKAFGYTNAEISRHYTRLVALVVILGAFVGCATGTWMAEGMTDMYRRFYRFPLRVFEPGLGIYLGAVSLALVSGGLGVFSGVRKAVRMPPAEAMQPAPPAVYQRLFLERVGLGSWLPTTTRMILRELERRPVKAALTTLGIAFAFSIIVLGNFGKDALDHLLDVQFGLAERDDARVSFVEPCPARAVYELQSIPGILTAEPFRTVGVRLRNGAINRQVGLMGLVPEGRLFQLLDDTGKRVSLAGDGCVLSAVLADRLGIDIGDAIRVEVLEHERPVRSIRVSGVIEDYTGTAAYMRLPALNRLLGEDRVVSGAYLQLDKTLEASVYTRLSNAPQVAVVSLKKAIIRGFLETIAENLLRMRIFNLLMASIIAIGVVYSSARISFSERSRDLATMRVIGLTRREVSGIMLGELAVITLLAIPLGIVIGYSLCYLLIASMETELYRIPLIIHRDTYGYASLLVIAAAMVSGLVIHRNIRRLDLVKALKVKE